MVNSADGTTQHCNMRSTKNLRSWAPMAYAAPPAPFPPEAFRRAPEDTVQCTHMDAAMAKASWLKEGAFAAVGGRYVNNMKLVWWV